MSCRDDDFPVSIKLAAPQLLPLCKHHGRSAVDVQLRSLKVPQTTMSIHPLRPDHWLFNIGRN